MKRVIITISALSLVLTLTACGGSGSGIKKDTPSASPAAESTQNVSPASQTGEAGFLYGQVTAVDGANVTVLLGEYAVPDMGGWEMPEDERRPEGMPDGGFGSGQTPPDLPEGGMPNGERPEMPEGGEMPWGDGERPEQPDGEGGGFGGDRGQMNFFTAGTEYVTYDLTDAEITVQNGAGTEHAAPEDLAVDSLLEITLNEDGTAASVRVMPSGGMGRGLE